MIILVIVKNRPTVIDGNLMSLTNDEITVIEKAADILNGWLKDLVGNNFGDMGCYIPLHAWYETHIIRAIDILIEKKPELGGSIKTECNTLLEETKSLSLMDEQNATDIQSKQAELALLARRIIPRLRRLAEPIPSEQKKELLSPTIQKAYQSYIYAEKKIIENDSNIKVTDDKAYDWLKENGTEDDDYELPDIEVWKRYVRKGRNHYGKQKNTPRAGRTHNIHTVSELESLDEITHKSKNKAD